MKKFVTCIAAGLLLVGSQSLKAQTTTNSTSVEPSTPAAATPDETKPKKHGGQGKLLKLIGLTRADLKGLSQDERKDKIKDATEKTMSDLKAKQANGTITADEQTQMDALKKIIAHQKKEQTNNQ